MGIHRTRNPRSVLCAIALCVIAGTRASPARADDQEAAAEPRGRIGFGLGGSWLPVLGGTATVIGRVSVGFNVGRFSFRALPTFQYVAITTYPFQKLSVGYLAVEGALRVTPNYAVSIAPLVGYAHGPDPTPQCFDVCYESLGNGLTVGADVSPATFVFGRDGSFELGLHGIFFEFPPDGQKIFLSGLLELRWLIPHLVLAVGSDQPSSGSMQATRHR